MKAILTICLSDQKNNIKWKNPLQRYFWKIFKMHKFKEIFLVYSLGELVYWILQLEEFFFNLKPFTYKKL